MSDFNTRTQLVNSPYHDDFNDKKGFHQILFRPGFSVQARELTQLQSIIRDQVNKFGNHIFRHGSIVVPGNSFADLGVPFIKLNASLDEELVRSIEGQKITGVISTASAIVKKVYIDNSGSSSVYYLFLTYYKGATDGRLTFTQGETITVSSFSTTSPTVQVLNVADFSGFGSLASVNEGIYYVSGSFVFVEKQTIVIDPENSSPSAKILLKVNEEIVDYRDDQSLLDPASGYNNFSAPGADRIKIDLELVSRSLTEEQNDDFIELMRYNDGVLEEHLTDPKYSEIEKNFARRTYDESGNFVLQGFDIDLREHNKTGDNNGVFRNGDPDLFVAEVGAGEAFLNGFEISTRSKTQIDIPKARTSDHIKSSKISIKQDFGRSILVTDFSNDLPPSIENRAQITFYKTDTSPYTEIGTARVIAIDSYVDDIYKLTIIDSTFVSDKTVSDANVIMFTDVGGNDDSTADVVTEFTARNVTQKGLTEKDRLFNRTGTKSTIIKKIVGESSKIYTIRNDTYSNLDFGDSVYSGDSPETAVSVGVDVTQKKTFFSPEESGASPLVFRLLDDELIKSLESVDGSGYTNLEYTIQKQYRMDVSSIGTASINAEAGEIFLPPEEGTFQAFVVENHMPDESPTSAGPIAASAFSLSDNGSAIILNQDLSLQNDTIYIFTHVRKRGTLPRVKTRKTNTQTIAGSVFDSSDVVQLNHADVISVSSIYNQNGDDFVDAFNFWNGQTDFEYTNATLTKKPTVTLNTADTFTVVYSYYDHSATGDFFCADSYPVTDLGANVQYVSQSNNQVYALFSCVDFRQKRENPGATEFFDPISVSGTIFTTDVQYFVPRIDSVVIQSDGNVAAVRGMPNENPSPPQFSVNDYELAQIFIPSYTRTLSDVRVTRTAVTRYKMKDIYDILKRTEKVERFAELTAQEQEILSYDPVDPETGLPREKTGYIVEDFDDPFNLGDVTNEEFSVTFVNDEMHPMMEKMECFLEFVPDSSSGFVESNGRLMKAYEEKTFIDQPISSDVTVINPFTTSLWRGVLDVFPPMNSEVEIRTPVTVFDEYSPSSRVKLPNYFHCPSYDQNDSHWVNTKVVFPDYDGINVPPASFPPAYEIVYSELKNTSESPFSSMENPIDTIDFYYLDQNAVDAIKTKKD